MWNRLPLVMKIGFVVIDFLSIGGFIFYFRN